MPITQINDKFKWSESEKLHDTRKEAVAEARDSYINTDRKRAKKPRKPTKKRVKFNNKSMLRKLT